MKHLSKILSSLLVLSLLSLGGCGGGQSGGAQGEPSLYFLSASSSTPAAIVLSFSGPVAPLGVDVLSAEAAPSIDPPIEGTWRWRDEARLTFEPSEPSKVFLPEKEYRIDFSKVALRSGGVVRGKRELRLPSLRFTLYGCSWEDLSSRAPIRRKFGGSLATNYPVYADSLGQAVKISIKDGAPLATSYSTGHSGTLRFSAPELPLPAKDSTIGAQLSPQEVRLYGEEGPTASFVAGGSCESDLKRADWLALESGQKQTATALNLSWGDAPSNAPFLKPLQVSIVGKYGAISARGADKTQVSEGVTLTPPHKGTWSYDSDISLIFKPEDPIPPGTKFDVTVSSFPGINFDKAVAATLQLDPPTTSIESFELYHNPERPRAKRLSATIVLSYPFERGSLEALTDLRMNGKTMTFDLVYDPKDPARAYLKSQEFELPAKEGKAKLRIPKGVKAQAGGVGAEVSVERDLTIPSQSEVFQVSGASASEVPLENGSVERILDVSTTVAVDDSADLLSRLDIFLLPECGGNEEKRAALCSEKDITQWSDPAEVDSRVEKVSQKLTTTWKSSVEPEKRDHLFSFSAPENREILVRVRAGAKARGDYVLAKDARFVVHIGMLQRELRIMHDGALLSLSGDKKLGLVSRGVKDIRVGLRRVTPENFHQFAALATDKFQRPYSSLDFDSLVEEFSYEESFLQQKDLEKRYTSVDFSKFLGSKGPPRGLFILTVRSKSDVPPPPDVSKLDERVAQQQMSLYKQRLKHVDLCDGESASWDPDASQDGESEEGEDEEGGSQERSMPSVCDQRMVLITDLGLLVKRSETSEQDLFVMSFRSGEPVSGAKVSLIGKNGVPLFSEVSNDQGRVHFPRVDTLVREKQPTTYIVEKGEDLAFLPYDRSDRRLNLSRFDTGGINNIEEFNSLQGYVFTDRGIYRPGDTVRIGALVRKKGWAPLPAGLPLEVSIVDSRSREVFKGPLSFDSTGFVDLSWSSSAGGATGTYRAELHLVGGSKRDRLSQIGGTSFRVEEFQPDRLMVKTEILSERGTAIVDQRDARAKVTVRNLFGTLAVGNTTGAEISVRPWSGVLLQYPGFQFRRTAKDDLPTAAEKLGEQTTAQDGTALFQLGLEKYNEPVFEFTLAGEGFEKGSGRSVVSVASTVATSLSHLVGFKADGDLEFIHKDSERSVDLIAVNSKAEMEQADGLQLETVELTYQSTLVRQPNGLFAYQSVEKTTSVDKTPLSIPRAGYKLKLATNNAGRFKLKITDKSGSELLTFPYTVAGEGNVSKSLERNADLTLTLNKEEYEPGSDLEVNIVAPYTGAGLLTIESDRVHTQKWFKTTTTSTTEKIKLPEDLKGNAYLSVAFVRSFDSPEIFMSPLSYGVAPFKVSKARWSSRIKLDVPAEVVPGTDLDVALTMPETGKVVVYAVDEGILQFARYRNPQPLDHFFRKRALQVNTYQILDLILPDYQMVQKVSAGGGDEDSGAGRYKNPFARKQKPPMAFWSGLSELKAGTHHIKVPVPTYFSGSIRVLAVAANQDRIGTAAQSTIAKGPFIVQPQQPYAVAPGDEFDVGAVVGNNTPAKDVSVSLKVPEGVTVLSENPLKIALTTGADAAVRFRVKAAEKLGPTALGYSVSGGGQTFSDSEELSVRPAQPFMVLNSQGRLSVDDQRAGKAANFSSTRHLFDEFRSVQVSVSGTPFGLLSGVVRYLKEYPYGCTEQIVSQAFPALFLGGNDELGYSKADAQRFIDKAMKTLAQRQRDDGSFGLWSVQSASDSFYSVYATHFLVAARFSGYSVSQRVYEEALRYLRESTNQVADDGHELRAQSYALYVLAVAGEVVTDKLKRLEEATSERLADVNSSDPWIRLFLAAGYRLNNFDADALRLYGEFASQWRSHKTISSALLSDPAAIGAYLFVTHNHFGDAIKDKAFKDYLWELSQEMLKRRVNSLSGSFALLGLGQFWRQFGNGDIGSFTLSSSHGAGAPTEVALSGTAIKRAEVPKDDAQFALKGDGTLQLYYQLSESGYDKDSSTSEIEKGIKLSRRLLNGQGQVASGLGISDALTYEITINPSKSVNDLAIVAIVPGGFEVDLTDAGLGQRRSLPLQGGVWEPEHVEVMEDRVILFGDIGSEARSFAFKLKPVTKGRYQVPPLFAEGMYDNEILYRGVSSSIEVTE